MASSEISIKPWLRPAPRPYLLANASIVDVVAGTVRHQAALLVRGGTIAAVTDSTAAVVATAEAEGATVIDCAGAFVCPGLIDCHVHVMSTPGTRDLAATLAGPRDVSVLRQPYVCAQMLHRGFTTIRDCAGTQLPLKQAVAEGVFPGPRIFLAGQALSQTGGHGDTRGPLDHQHSERADVSCCGGHGHSANLGRVCDGVAQCLEAARDQIRTGSDFIKIMGSGGVASPTDRIEQLQFTPEEIRAIVACADNAGTYVTAHAYTARAIRRCIENGVRGIEHGNLLDAPTAALMAERGVFLTPTLVAYDEMAADAWAGFLPPENARKNREVLHAGLQALKMAVDAGVTVCFGSDLLGPLGTAQSREFRIRAAVIPALSVLQSATINAARMIGWADRIGQLQPGFIADLLICRANPLEDVTVLDDPEANILVVMKEGRVEKSRRTDVAEDSIPVRISPFVQKM